MSKSQKKLMMKTTIIITRYIIWCLFLKYKVWMKTPTQTSKIKAKDPSTSTNKCNKAQKISLTINKSCLV